MGMTCEGCVGAAKKVLGKLGGMFKAFLRMNPLCYLTSYILDDVVSVDADLSTKTVTVQTTLSSDQIKTQLEKTGKDIELLS